MANALCQLSAAQSAPLDEHVERVSKLSARTAEALGAGEHDVRQIRLAAKLHDVGKTAIPSAILDKTGPLDAHEWTLMRRHSVIGEQIVLSSAVVASSAPIIRSSHERVDGRGYPDGLAGAEIPLAARIIAVCDAFDAMTSHRPYRMAISEEAAIAELRANAGSQFDRRVVDTFDRVIASDVDR
jgi:two-component system cell cycle response regulator